MVFLISAHIVLYRHRKSGHHLGTKASKIIAVISVLMSEKVCIYRDFHSSRLFGRKNQILFFISSALIAAEEPGLVGINGNLLNNNRQTGACGQ